MKKLLKFVTWTDEIESEIEVAEEINLRVLSKIRAVKDATNQDASDEIKTTHGHETSSSISQALALRQTVDSEDEQPLPGPGSAAGFGIETTIGLFHLKSAPPPSPLPHIEGFPVTPLQKRNFLTPSRIA